MGGIAVCEMPDRCFLLVVALFEQTIICNKKEKNGIANLF